MAANRASALDPAASFSALMSKIGSAQKSRHGASLYLRLINRPLGRVLAVTAFKLHLTPNFVSALGGVITYAACIVVAIFGKDQVLAIVASAALVFGYALDSADGQLARLSGRTSLSGEFLDRCIDLGKLVLLHAAIISVLVRDQSIDPVMAGVTGTAFLTATIVQSTGSVLRTELWKRHPQANNSPTHSEPSALQNLKSVFYLGKEYGSLCVLVGILPLTPAFAIGYFVLGLATVITSILLIVKWYRELRAFDNGRKVDVP